MHTGSLLKPESFQRQGRWYICKLCDVGNKEKERMSMAAAKIHEISEQHVYQIERHEWDMKNLWGIPGGEVVVDDLNAWGTKMTKTEKLKLIVEYWYKGVQAADRGEELKFEYFLETLED